MSQSYDELEANLRACRCGSGSGHEWWELMAEAADAIAALRRDAERYRWLRDQNTTRWSPWAVEREIVQGDQFMVVYPSGEKLDEAIDAAIAAAHGPLLGSKDDTLAVRPNPDGHDEAKA